VFCALLLPAALGGMYVLSVAWRVGCAEEELYGRNCTLPMHKHSRDFREGPIAGSYQFRTYTFIRKDGTKVKVHRQLINGFQHAYGSALACLELGAGASDLMFRLNEYCEAYTKKWGKTYAHSLDTRKDLANNLVGRRIAEQAWQRGLAGADADRFMKGEILAAIERGVVLNHYLDPRVQKLPTLAEFGCPFLPNPAKPEDEMLATRRAVSPAL
jgi:hypothetical protein